MRPLPPPSTTFSNTSTSFSEFTFPAHRRGVANLNRNRQFSSSYIHNPPKGEHYPESREYDRNMKQPRRTDGSLDTITPPRRPTGQSNRRPTRQSTRSRKKPLMDLFRK